MCGNDLPVLLFSNQEEVPLDKPTQVSMLQTATPIHMYRKYVLCILITLESFSFYKICARHVQF